MPIQRVLCVCIGNSDRSPAMAAVLKMFLGNTSHHEVVCESAGISENAAKGGSASPWGVTAAKRIGIDLSGHSKRHIGSLDLAQYDLIICASDDIAGKVIEAGADMGRVYNAQITNPWPCQFQQDYDGTFQQVLASMYGVIARYFS